MYPPAFCPVHGLFPATAFPVRPGVLEANYVGTRQGCPAPGCNRIGEVISGIYSAGAKGALNVLLDPSISPEALEALKDLISKVETGEITPEQAQEKAASFEPKFTEFFSKIDWPNQAVGLFVGVIAGLIVARMTTQQPADTPSQNPTSIEITINKQEFLNTASWPALATRVTPPSPRLKPKKPDSSHKQSPSETEKG